MHVARRVRELEEHRPVAKLPSSIQAAKYVALDCEMVGVHTIVPASSSSGSSSTTQTSSRSVLARISIVNFYGTLLYDSYVSPPERITDFRTTITGITPQQLKTAKPLLQVLHEVDDIIKDKIIIGHGLENDFKVRPAGARCEKRVYWAVSLTLAPFLGVAHELSETAHSRHVALQVLSYKVCRRSNAFFAKAGPRNIEKIHPKCDT